MSTKKEREPDRPIEVSDSTNTAIVFGDRNVITQNVAPILPIEMPPESDDDLTIRIGKWIMLKLFGTLKHSMKVYGLIFAILGIAIGYPTFQPSLLIQTFGVENFVWIEMGLLLLLTGVLFFGWIIFVDSSTTTCPKCGWKFSWLKTKRILKNRVELSNAEVRNYETTYSCTNPSCNYKRESVPEIVRIPTSSGSI